jgi:hypothetical protein
VAQALSDNAKIALMQFKIFNILPLLATL